MTKAPVLLSLPFLAFRFCLRPSDSPPFPTGHASAISFQQPEYFGAYLFALVSPSFPTHRSCTYPVANGPVCSLATSRLFPGPPRLPLPGAVAYIRSRVVATQWHRPADAGFLQNQKCLSTIVASLQLHFCLHPCEIVAATATATATLRVF